MTEAEALKWIAELFQEPPGRLTPATPRREIASWDSLGVLTLMADLDEKFQIVTQDGEVQALATVGDILGLLRCNGKLTD